jgi:hypothetical protein
MEWKQVEPANLMPEQLGKPIYVRFPDTYARDFLLGTLEWVAGTKNLYQVGLAGGVDTVDIYKSSDRPQAQFFVLGD